MAKSNHELVDNSAGSSEEVTYPELHEQALKPSLNLLHLMMENKDPLGTSGSLR